MSELKLTISQLENLLDRQKKIIQADIQTQMEDHKASCHLIKLAQETIIKAEYPYDFNILKKYVK